MLNGYIKISRKIDSWGWRCDPNTFSVFLYLLTNANFQESEYRGHKLFAGQLVTGRDAISLNTGISAQSVRTALTRLKSTKEITIKTTNKFSIITITKWSEFQDCNQLTNQQLTNNQPTTNHTLRRERKKERKNINIIPPEVSEKVWEDFLILRKAKKAPVTDAALAGIQYEADKLGWTLERAMIEMCARGWQGFKAEWIQQKGKTNGKSNLANQARDLLESLGQE